MLMALELLGAFFVRQIEQQDLRTFQQQIALPAAVKSQLEVALQNPDSKEANRSIQSTLSNLHNQNIQEIQVIDANGTIRGTQTVAGRQTVGQKTTDINTQNALNNNGSYHRIRTVRENGNRLQLVTTALTSEGNNRLGVVVVTANLESVYDNISRITKLFLWAGLIAFLLSIAMALFLARTLTRPIEKINEQTTKIANGDYSMINHIHGADELSQLAQSVNELSARVEESTEAVNSERNRLDSVLTHMADGVLATNRRGEVTIINQAAANFVGLQPEEAIGMPIVTLLGLEGKTTLRDMLEKPEELLLDLSNPQQELIVQAYVSLIKRQSGFISGIVIILHDITEQQRIDVERRSFVSNVSHELRTPLTSVRSYVDALADGAIDNPEMAHQFLGVVQDETQRMIRMINDLLELSRLDQGRLEVKPEMVNLNRLFGYVLDRFDMILDSEAQEDISSVERQTKRYHIDRDFVQEDVWVEVDPDKFTQVLDNLMNNAVKYSPDGGTITARLVKTKQRAILSISDEGLGIPRKDLDNIFNRFFRVDKARSREQGGTGLGLAISKEVVELFNGRIWADSMEGRGSTFYIALDFVDYDVAEVEEWDAE
jgi:two-component system sensor histidine kinase VicK